MLSVLALFITLVLAQDDNKVDLLEEHLIGARYDETADRHRNLFSVKRLDDKTFGLDSILQAQLFVTGADGEDGDVYIGTSMFNDYKTYKGAQPLLKWNDDDKQFDTVSVQPALRTNIDAQSAINYFKTKDGNTWAYNALYAIQNSTVRNTGLIGGNGSSYIFKLDGDSFSATPSFTFFTNFSTSRSAYFQTADGREFLWTFSWGPGNAPAPVPGARTPILSDNRNANPAKCSLIEYKSGTWSLERENFIGCPSRPRSPLSFKNTAGSWVYFFPSFGGGGVLTLNYRGATNNPQWEATNDVLDGFGIPEATELHHWVDADDEVSYDMITATTPTSVRTYRLHWDTHYVEELPAVTITQGSPYDFSWFMPGDRRCFVVGSASYPGLQSLSPPAIQNFYTSIFCWDQSRDVWDLAIRFPAELCWFNQVFSDPSDENAWYLVTMHRSHLTKVSVKLYHLHIEDDDHIHVKFDEAPSVSYTEQSAKDVHENRHMIIATLSLVAFTVVVVLLSLFMSLSGGGGSSGDYTSFNN